jgi:hypothetical protein
MKSCRLRAISYQVTQKDEAKTTLRIPLKPLFTIPGVALNPAPNERESNNSPLYMNNKPKLRKKSLTTVQQAIYQLRYQCPYCGKGGMQVNTIKIIPFFKPRCEACSSSGAGVSGATRLQVGLALNEALTISPRFPNRGCPHECN